MAKMGKQKKTKIEERISTAAGRGSPAIPDRYDT